MEDRDRRYAEADTRTWRAWVLQCGAPRWPAGRRGPLNDDTGGEGGGREAAQQYPQTEPNSLKTMTAATKNSLDSAPCRRYLQ